MPGYQPSGPYVSRHHSPLANSRGFIRQFFHPRSGRPTAAQHATTRIDSVETNGSFLPVGGSTSASSAQGGLAKSLSAGNTPAGTPCRIDRLWGLWGLWDNSTELFPGHHVGADCARPKPAPLRRPVLRIDIQSHPEINPLDSNSDHSFGQMLDCDSSSDRSDRSDAHSATSQGTPIPSARAPSFKLRPKTNRQHFFADMPRSTPVSSPAVESAIAPASPAPIHVTLSKQRSDRETIEPATDEHIEPQDGQEAPPSPVLNSNNRAETGIWSRLIYQAREMTKSFNVDINCNPLCCFDKNNIND